MTELVPQSLSIVLPCHNEAMAIPTLLQGLEHSIERLKTARKISEAQIIVVDDASTDTTGNVLNAFQHIETIKLLRRSGYGAALKAGFRQARGELIAFLDLDETYDPADLTRLVELLQMGHLDLVLGDRMTCKEGMSLTRRFGNRFFSLLVRFFSGEPIRDACTGYRIFRRSFLSEVCRIGEDGLNFSLAMTLLALRARVTYFELPIAYRNRIGDSKLRILADGMAFFWTVLKFQLSTLASRTGVERA